MTSFTNYPGRQHRSSGPRGFTLIELMVVLLVIAVLVAIAMPSFRTLVMNNRLATASGEVQNALIYARSEAVTRRQPVSACPSANGTACTGGNGWGGGLIVFTDRGTAGTVDGNDQILKYVQLTGALTIAPVPSDNFGGNTYVNFTATGTAVASGTLKSCDTRTGNFGRELQVLATGRTEATRQVACP